MRNRVEVMHGVNFDVLERRDPEHYGGLHLTELEVRVKRFARELALEVARLPAVEVHLSAIDEREEWRRVSVIRDLCVGSVQGRGVDGYRDALEMLKEAMQA